MAKRKTKRSRKHRPDAAREQVLAVFADYAEHDPEKLVDFLQHCQIDLEPYLANKAELPDIIAAHFYIRPGVYDIASLGELLATFPPIAAVIRERQAELAAQGLA
jgi:hypothetical protein